MESSKEETAEFIRQHRSNESNFEKIYTRLEEEIKTNSGSGKYVAALQAIKEKSAEEYKKAKETGGTAWPEFEKFVAAFETTVLEHSK